MMMRTTSQSLKMARLGGSTTIREQEHTNTAKLRAPESRRHIFGDGYHPRAVTHCYMDMSANETLKHPSHSRPLENGDAVPKGIRAGKASWVYKNTHTQMVRGLPRARMSTRWHCRSGESAGWPPETTNSIDIDLVHTLDESTLSGTGRALWQRQRDSFLWPFRV